MQFIDTQFNIGAGIFIGLCLATAALAGAYGADMFEGLTIGIYIAGSTFLLALLVTLIWVIYRLVRTQGPNDD
jgi:hypothetical protein